MCNIKLSLLGGILFICQLLPLHAQEMAPNDIPIPWYSQKISGCPYAHCSLASSLMVFDYYKGMSSTSQREPEDAEKKLVEYQRNYFMKKRAPFRRRTSLAQGSYYPFELDSLARYYEEMKGADYFYQKDYKKLKEYIDSGTPVLVNVSYRSSMTGLIPGSHRHWIVLRGMTDDYVWINDPGRSASMRQKGENKRYPIKRQKGNPSYFDGCWTGRYIVINPKEQMGPLSWPAEMFMVIEIPEMSKELKPHPVPPDANATK